MSKVFPIQALTALVALLFLHGILLINVLRAIWLDILRKIESWKSRHLIYYHSLIERVLLVKITLTVYRDISLIHIVNLVRRQRKHQPFLFRRRLKAIWLFCIWRLEQFSKLPWTLAVQKLKVRWSLMVSVGVQRTLTQVETLVEQFRCTKDSNLT